MAVPVGPAPVARDRRGIAPPPRAEPVRKALLEVLLYASGTYLFEPGCIEACFLSCFAGHAAIYIESKFPRRAGGAAVQVVPASAVAVAI